VHPPAEEETIITDPEDMQEDMKENTAETEKKGADIIPPEEGVPEVLNDKKGLEGGESHPHVQNRAQDLEATLPHLKK